jgi:ribosomal protein L37E
MFIVFRCRKCGRYLYAGKDVKTRQCTCGHRNNLRKVRIVARAKNEVEASEIVRKMQGSGTGFRSLA